MGARHWELFSGLAAAVLGLLSLAYVVFGPTYRYTSMTATVDGPVHTESGRASLAQPGLEPVTAIFLVVILAAVVGVAVGASLHSRWGGQVGLKLLWLSAVVLLGGAFLRVFSVGLYLLPVALLALLAATAGLMRATPA